MIHCEQLCHFHIYNLINLKISIIKHSKYVISQSSQTINKLKDIQLKLYCKKWCKPFQCKKQLTTNKKYIAKSYYWSNNNYSTTLFSLSWYSRVKTSIVHFMKYQIMGSIRNDDVATYVCCKHTTCYSEIKIKCYYNTFSWKSCVGTVMDFVPIFSVISSLYSSNASFVTNIWNHTHIKLWTLI
jgi:hypothetical protein